MTRDALPALPDDKDVSYPFLVTMVKCIRDMAPVLIISDCLQTVRYQSARKVAGRSLSCLPDVPLRPCIEGAQKRPASKCLKSCRTVPALARRSLNRRAVQQWPGSRWSEQFLFADGGNKFFQIEWFEVCDILEPFFFILREGGNQH